MSKSVLIVTSISFNSGRESEYVYGGNSWNPFPSEFFTAQISKSAKTTEAKLE